MALFELTARDRSVYEEQLRPFLPDEMIDIHTHVWLDSLLKPVQPGPDEKRRTVTWPSLVAKDNAIEDLDETYRLMFPGKRVEPLMFAGCGSRETLDACNAYVLASAQKTGYPALYYASPEQSAEELEQCIVQGGFLGVKSYLDLSPRYLPEDEIRIFDFFPPHQLAVLDRLGLIMMLHIPRRKRLKDPVNLAQILEIKQRFPGIRLIVAHIGRAYCQGDVGNAFEVLAEAPDLLFDFCANTSEDVMLRALEAVGPNRLLFGSDLPITRMRMRRIEENGAYINLIPQGLYGDPNQDSHLREVPQAEGALLTFFMYEELLAFKRAAQRAGLTQSDVGQVFHHNARRVLDDAAQSRRCSR